MITSCRDALASKAPKLPALPVLLQLARLLHVPISDLLGESPATAKPTPPLEAGAAIHQALTQPVLDGGALPAADLHD